MEAGIQAASAFSPLATTGTSGFALANSTSNILTWTAPSDGQLHRVTVFASMTVTSNETGGNIGLQVYYPDGNSVGWTIFSGGQSSGANYTQSGPMLTVEPGGLVAVQQWSALTAGAAKTWLELWGG
jgi:hypothetical protein